MYNLFMNKKMQQSESAKSSNSIPSYSDNDLNKSGRPHFNSLSDEVAVQKLVEELIQEKVTKTQKLKEQEEMQEMEETKASKSSYSKQLDDYNAQKLNNEQILNAQSLISKKIQSIEEMQQLQRFVYSYLIKNTNTKFSEDEHDGAQRGNNKSVGGIDRVGAQYSVLMKEFFRFSITPRLLGSYTNKNETLTYYNYKASGVVNTQRLLAYIKSMFYSDLLLVSKLYGPNAISPEKLNEMVGKMGEQNSGLCKAWEAGVFESPWANAKMLQVGAAYLKKNPFSQKQTIAVIDHIVSVYQRIKNPSSALVASELLKELQVDTKWTQLITVNDQSNLTTAQNTVVEEASIAVDQVQAKHVTSTIQFLVEELVNIDRLSSKEKFKAFTLQLLEQAGAQLEGWVADNEHMVVGVHQEAKKRKAVKGLISMSFSKDRAYLDRSIQLATQETSDYGEKLGLFKKMLYKIRSFFVTEKKEAVVQKVAKKDSDEQSPLTQKLANLLDVVKNASKHSTDLANSVQRLDSAFIHLQSHTNLSEAKQEVLKSYSKVATALESIIPIINTLKSVSESHSILGADLESQIKSRVCLCLDSCSSGLEETAGVIKRNTLLAIEKSQRVVENFLEIDGTQVAQAIQRVNLSTQEQEKSAALSTEAAQTAGNLNKNNIVRYSSNSSKKAHFRI